jgi:PAS domain S-box-containing protein
MVNPATVDLFKLPEEEIIGRTDRQIYQRLGLDPLQAETVMANDRQVIETGETERSAEVRFELMGGLERWFSTTKTPVSAPEDPRCCLTIAVDVSDQHNTREALRNSELRLRTILDAQTSKVVHMDTEMRILWPNLAACKDAGVDRDTIIGKHCHEIWKARATACTNCPVQAAIETGKPQMCQKRSQDGRTWRLIGSPVYDDAGRIVSAVEIAEDITERHSIEEQLRQAQKMESLGTLAGGIAHDFNNILSAILGYADLALAEAAGDAKLSDYLREIHDAGDRATDLVRQILTFSRRGTTELKPLMIDLIIKEALKLLRSTLPSTIDIVQRVSPNLDPILADPTQIHQIIMNLCTNASHAMTPAGGQLSVTLEQKELGADFFRRFVDAQPGSYLQLCVRDTGCGMTPEIMAAIFDPYFTTKDLGEGTGLGLAVVHGIVKEYGGDIRVRSKPEQGTTFELYFPTIRAASTRPQADEALHLPGGNEHILVVDDEPSILKVTEQLLRKLGYRVTTAPDGKPALALFSKDPNAFDLVITDITMPHMTGDRLAKAILELRPDTPVILCTGYSRLIDEAQAESIGIAALMIKPVGKTTLAVELRRLLDERPQVTQDGSTAY